MTLTAVRAHFSTFVLLNTQIYKYMGEGFGSKFSSAFSSQLSDRIWRSWWKPNQVSLKIKHAATARNFKLHCNFCPFPSFKPITLYIHCWEATFASLRGVDLLCTAAVRRNASWDDCARSERLCSSDVAITVNWCVSITSFIKRQEGQSVELRGCQSDRWRLEQSSKLKSSHTSFERKGKLFLSTAGFCWFDGWEAETPRRFVLCSCIYFSKIFCYLFGLETGKSWSHRHVIAFDKVSLPLSVAVTLQATWRRRCRSWRPCWRSCRMTCKRCFDFHECFSLWVTFFRDPQLKQKNQQVEETIT